MHHAITHTITLWICLTFISVTYADPNHLKPDAALKLHGTVADSKALYSQLLAAREKVFSLTAKLDADVGTPKEYAELNVELERIKRIGGRLLTFGEAIGYEAPFPIKSRRMWNRLD